MKEMVHELMTDEITYGYADLIVIFDFHAKEKEILKFSKFS